jgi:hypothetical protein
MQENFSCRHFIRVCGTFWYQNNQLQEIFGEKKTAIPRPNPKEEAGQSQASTRPASRFLRIPGAWLCRR